MEGNIDFAKSQNWQVINQGIGASEQKPLRIAFASVISPIETRKSYQAMVRYISQQMGRPAVLIQR